MLLKYIRIRRICWENSSLHASLSPSGWLTPGKEDAGESGKGQGNGDVPSRWKGRQKPVAQPVSVWSPQLTATANTC